MQVGGHAGKGGIQVGVIQVGGHPGRGEGGGGGPSRWGASRFPGFTPSSIKGLVTRLASRWDWVGLSTCLPCKLEAHTLQSCTPSCKGVHPDALSLPSLSLTPSFSPPRPSFLPPLPHPPTCSGHGAELFTYWKYLDSNVSIMTSQYYKSLRKMEEEGGREGGGWVGER